MLAQGNAASFRIASKASSGNSSQTIEFGTYVNNQYRPAGTIKFSRAKRQVDLLQSEAPRPRSRRTLCLSAVCRLAARSQRLVVSHPVRVLVLC